MVIFHSYVSLPEGSPHQPANLPCADHFPRFLGVFPEMKDGRGRSSGDQTWQWNIHQLQTIFSWIFPAINLHLQGINLPCFFFFRGCHFHLGINWTISILGVLETVTSKTVVVTSHHQRMQLKIPHK